ncbi:MAG: CheR family methyltransferase [Acetobacteraceae bacterium]
MIQGRSSHRLATAARSQPLISPVVGIGASLGGAGALQRLFQAVRPGCRLAFLLVQDLDPNQKGMLGDLLAPVSPLPVTWVRNDTAIEAGHVYAVPRNAALTIINGRLRLLKPWSRRDHRSPIDDLFGALALDQGANAAGIVLSGGGSDGAFGLRAIKEHGGVAFVEREPGYHEMIRDVVAVGLVDFVLRAEDMPARLEDYFRCQARTLRRQAAIGIPASVLENLPEICALLRTGAGHDFSGYEEDTIARRVQRRMNALAIDDGPRFIERLRQDPREVRLLFQDFLISVTNFFRESRAFAALARKVIPRIFGGKDPDDTVRVWVPGCATGEEAYSIAMLLEEQMARAFHPPKFQLFASDIKQHALEVARSGRYPASIARDVSAIRLERYFTPENGAYRISDRLRRTCLFSVHDLLRDAPLSRLDLISCRNLLVYLNTDLRNHVLSMFHDALVPTGYLFLGAPENVPRGSHLFATVDGPHRIFRRRNAFRQPEPPRSAPRDDG